MDEQQIAAIDPETKRAMMRRRATQVKCFASCVIPVGIADLATHTGLGGLIFGGAAAIALSTVYPDMKEDFGSVLAPVREILAPLTAPIGGRSILDRAIGRYPVQVEECDEEVSSGHPKDDTLHPGIDETEEEYDWESDEDDVVLMPATHPIRFTFSDVLAKGFRPSLKRIYLGTLDGGTDVIVPVEDLCHVALAGLTGNGKGTIMRLIMSQLCAIGVRVLLLNPHYAGYDQSGGEDWTPFERMNAKGEPFLQQPPLPCSEETKIAMYLEWMAQTLIPQRKALAQEYKPIGRPYFVVVDEWPDVVKECAKKKINVVEHLEKLLREGRKYGIYVVVASQDFQVKTIGVDGGGVRKCFKTVLYVGGDAATARALLGDTTDIRENALGGGSVILRCKAVPEPKKARVPYVDNAALYLLLGPTLLDPSVFHLNTTRKVEEIALPIVKSAQPVQAFVDEQEDESISMHARCESVLKLADAHFGALDIIAMLKMSEGEYRAIKAYVESHWSEFREPSSTSVPTSQVSGVSTSVPTSRQEKKLYLVNGHEGSNEEGRSGLEVEEPSEVDAIEKSVLTEREIRMGELFFEERVGINVIMKELYPGVTGGDRYQKANAEITDALRKYVEVRKGA